MDRRAFLTRLGAAAAGSALLSTFTSVLSSTAAKAAEEPVTVMGWGGPWKDAIMKALADPFSEKSGIPVRYVSPYDYSKLLAMDQAKQQQFDAVEVNGMDSTRMIRDNLGTPLDFSIIDKNNLSPEQLEYPNAIGACSVATVMIYSKKRWPGDDHPKTWADFWDQKKYPGGRSLQRTPVKTLEFALLADGVPKDKLYPLDLDRAFKKLEEIKPHIVTWFSTGSEPQQLIASGELEFTAIWSTRANDSILNQNQPFEIIWDGGASEGNAECWFVCRGCPNPTGAMKFLNFAASAEPQAAFARIIFAAPVNQKAYKLLDKKFAETMPSYPANEEKMFQIDFKYWVDNYEAVTQRFETWIQS
ncbi:ABC transporter substrate-binding protein [Ancylobacter mangrovi]|uniref:ABC transporter substrate-binding protein n=1 Tax=Ancylobacter mangrovi TaxID=2972472 RepID=A0A9X2PLT8_9HYPH|nr:ABC transporter substrate-binding protein [Ancylobacter mangrovi]MCS0497462.1 ABC transporter substrate-binding protein [Ancylobacter mangrovi]MCS0503988.1 ABC transporter substrate-binding protein [Ancylobacter mangrovi]